MLPEPLGPYRLVESLGRGAFGQVWRARHVLDEREVALKVLVGAKAESQQSRMALAREARTLATLSHPNVLAVHDFGVAPEGHSVGSAAPWLATELADGDLAVRPSRSWTQLRQALQDILAGLAHLHAAGLVHQDLKPANILRGRDGHWKIADFGLATAFDEPIDRVGGTRGFVAPEQLLRDVAALGPPADLFAVGGLAWYLLHRPERLWPKGALVGLTDGDELRWEPRFAVPAGLRRWVGDLLWVDTSARPASAAEAWEALCGLDGPSTAAGLPPSWRTTRVRPVAPRLGLLGLRSPPLLGRDDLCDELWERAGAVWGARTPAVVTLSAPEGTGTTRAAGFIGRRAAETGRFRFLATGFAPWRDALEDLIVRTERLHKMSVVDARDRLVERHGELGAELAAVAYGHSEGAAPVTATARPATVGRWLARIAEARPLVLLLDDAHRSLEAVELARAVLQLDAPCFVLMTVDPEERADDPITAARWSEMGTLSGWFEIAVPVIDEATHRQIVTLLVGHGPARDAILERTADTPLLSIPLARDLALRGALVGGVGGLRLAADTTWPKSLSRLWEARADRLLASLVEHLPLLDLAVALGRRVDVDVWEAAAAAQGLPSPRPLSLELVAGRVLVRVQRSTLFRWSHGALLERLASSAADRRTSAPAHAACAAALQARQADPGEVGRHLLEAGAPESALGHLMRACRRRLAEADARGALAMAKAAWRAADAAAPERLGEIRLLRARAWAMLGELERAEHDAELLDDRAAALLGRLALRRGEPSEAETHFEVAIAWARDRGNRAAEARALHGLARALLAEGRDADVAAALREADEAAGDDPGAAFRSTRMWLLGELALRGGDPGGALACFVAADDVIANPMRQQMRAKCLDGIGTARAALGDKGGAANAWYEAVALHTALGTSAERAARGLASLL